MIFSALVPHLMAATDTGFEFLTSSLLREIILGMGILVTLVGVYHCWHAPSYRMSIEERAKDGKMTDAEAHRSIQRLNWFGPMVVLGGMAVISLAVLH